MDQRQKKLIIGGVVAVAVVAAIYFAFRGSSNILQLEEPKFDLKDLANKTDRDYKVLFAFQGYLKYLDASYGKQVFLPLVPVAKTLEVSGLDKNQSASQNVIFNAEHATVSIGFLAGDSDFHIKPISISTDDGDAKKSCHVNEPEIAYNLHTHFESTKPIHLSCARSVKDKDGKVVETQVAELVISAMRAEVNGNQSDHKAGKFTYPIVLHGHAQTNIKQNEEVPTSTVSIQTR